MNNFKKWFIRFAQGRYGIDTLFYILMVTYIVIAFINFFAHSIILYFIGVAVMVYSIWRVLSRNVAKRYKENQFVLNKLGLVKISYNKSRSRMKQQKTHCFKKCPNCGKTLRLPRVRGKHFTQCPSCQCKFKIFIWLGMK